MFKLFEYVVLAIVAVIALGMTMSVYEENKRARLLASYAAPAELLVQLRTLGVQSVGALLKHDESVMCLMDGYGSAEDLPQLSNDQRKSLPKDMLPSEDGARYLIFLSDTQHTRIYLIEEFGPQGLDTDIYGCLKQEQSVQVVPHTYPDGTPGLKLMAKFESRAK
jgi:hypothetical protein